MAIAFESQDGNQGLTTFSFACEPTNAPKGVIVFIVDQAATSDQVTGVTYGGVAMQEIALSPVSPAGGSPDPVRIHGYFLGSGVPSGVQTCEVTCSGTTLKVALAVTFTAATSATEVADTDAPVSASGANPAASLQDASGQHAMAFGALYSGHSAITSIGPGAGATNIGELDLGNESMSVIRTTTSDIGDRSLLWAATAESYAVLAALVRELSPNATVTPAPVAMAIALPQASPVISPSLTRNIRMGAP